MSVRRSRVLMMSGVRAGMVTLRDRVCAGHLTRCRKDRRSGENRYDDNADGTCALQAAHVFSIPPALKSASLLMWLREDEQGAAGIANARE